MGRPEPCVLFAQTFVHPQLDEYVDEVLFAEPIVITACEFLEQNASSASQSVTLVGATSPPSFALEVFVQCEGETRFRRLCQPFLYSHSSSNVLEVEAVVTNHLVVRGSYRSLSLIIYGNTAEDLGQFNIGFDDSSITNLVTSAEGKLEDLPLALHSTDLTIDESISSLKALSFPPLASDISIEAKQLLLLLLKILELPHLGDGLHKIVSSVVSAASSYVSHAWDRCSDRRKLQSVISEARKELLELFQHKSRDESAELLVDGRFLESEADLVTSKQLVDMLSQYFCFNRESLCFGHHQISKSTSVIMGLSVALLLCSGRESCFHFVNGRGMDQLAHVFCDDMQNSSATTLLLLGVVEQATRHSFGCEAFLGWWPREDENIPPGSSEAYNRLLNLLLQKPRHDVASLATYILHRLRFYEVVLRYECAVLSVLGGCKATNVTLDMLISAKSQLKKLVKLMNFHGPIEDPSPASVVTRSLNLGQTEGLLSYKATSSLIASSHCCFSNWDVDSHLLALLKERGFLPLSVALLSSSSLRSEVGHIKDIFMDIASSIEAIILSLLFCRSGLVFLLQQPELSATVIHALRGSDDVNKDVCVPLRYASVLIAKGFFCGPREVGMIIGLHLRVVNAIDRLLTSAPHSEEFLWVLWELCGLARSDCGRQALLALGYFPEAISLLIEALHSAKEPEPVAKNSGALPINLAIFHSAAEIFEVIVTDSTASSLGSWIGHATELHRALHSSSPGSNRKDAPARLLEWIDAGVVYHRNGAIGLLRYAAVLASEGDAHLTTVVSDLTDLETIIGDTTGDSDVNVMENLGKFISEKTFDGVTLRDSSVAQLTISLRILAFISENSATAAALYDEGAITVIYTVLVNCRFMLERSSNSYDYLVDEGTECNSTSDILLERNREQSLVDLLVPSLVLLINLLQKLQEAEERHRNTKLMNALLRLHREVSPKLAACAADLSSSYPDAALGFGAICHLVASALACWPVYGWSPGLFHSLLASVQATSMLALGLKETCSLLCLLNDLFPEEGIWLWKKGMPLLSALRTLSIGTLLGPQKERQINWYLQPVHLEKLLGQLMPQLEKIAHIIQHYAISALVVIQDMLRVFVIRIAHQKAESCSVLLHPIFSWIGGHVSDSCSLSDLDTFKVFRYLDFLASLLEHPHAKALLVKEGIIQLLSTVLRQSLVAANSDGKHSGDGGNLSKFCSTTLSWCLPVFKSFALLCDFRTSIQHTVRRDLHNSENLNSEDCLLMLAYLLKFCQVLPAGKELLACLLAFKELGSCYEGQSSLASFYRIHSSFEEAGSQRGHEQNGNANYDILSEFEWRKRPPLLCCWKELLRSVGSRDSLLDYSVEAINVLSLGSLCFCVDGKSLKLDQVVAVKFLFGVAGDTNADDGVSEETIDYINKITSILHSKIAADDYVNYDMQPSLYQALDSAKALALLLQTPAHSVRFDDVFPSGFPLSFDDLISSKIHLMSDGSAERSEDYLYLGELGDKFLWDCPETLPDRFPQTTVKRKLPSVEGPNRRSRGENAPAEITGQNARGLGSSTTPSGPTRRDTFRQRKPNTSRPPSMHVDDYVARERNVDSATNSNVIAVQRIGATGGRPPSIHVDEFMARQRERQNPASAVTGDAAPQSKIAASVNDMAMEKSNKSKELKSDPDDDLHGIDIVFDGEESESDDKLPFPQPDDNLQQPAPLIIEQSSPHSIVEETESDIHEGGRFSHIGTPLASNIDENTHSEFSSRMSISRPEMPLTREPSVSSDKKLFERADDMKIVNTVKTSNGFDSTVAINSPGFPGSLYNNVPASSAQLLGDNRMTPQNFYPKNGPLPAGNVPMATGSQGLYDQRFMPSQPPLPPMPPPPTVAPVIPQTSDPVPSQSSPFVNSMTDVPLPTSFQVHAEYLSATNNSSTSLGSSLLMPDSKYSRTSLSSPGGSARPPPPLPPTPPPYPSNPYNLTPNRTSTSQSSMYHQTSVGTTDLPQSTTPLNDSRLGSHSTSGARINTYPTPPLGLPHLVFSRPGSIPSGIYGNMPTQQQGENLPSVLQNLSIPQSSMQTIHSVAQLQPLQPPQLPRPPQPPQHLRPPVQASQQLEQGTVQMQMHSLQMQQQPQVSSMHMFHQSPQQDFSHAQKQQQHVEHAPQQAISTTVDNTFQQQDSGMSLHEYFKSPEAIQSLLSDRDKLCQLLEQHPKLMQMLQEKLGQL